MIEFTPWMMLIKDTQIAKTVTATFQDPDRIDVEKRGRRTRTLARKFTIGTRGYNGSMVQVFEGHKLSVSEVEVRDARDAWYSQP